MQCVATANIQLYPEEGLGVCMFGFIVDRVACMGAHSENAAEVYGTICQLCKSLLVFQ